MFDILIKFPTRERPDKFRNQFDRYNNMLSGLHSVKFVVSMDADDATMNNDDMKWWLSPANGNRQNIYPYYGHSKTKVEAINADMSEHQDFKILLLASDDFTPQEHGYDDIIYQDMMKHFPDLDGCLHYPDGRVGERLNTLVIMGVNLYKEWGYIYHPDYISLWCDNEYTDVTRERGKVVWIDRCVIKHEWTSYTGADQLHFRNESFYNHDGETYRKRKAAGFPRTRIGTEAPTRFSRRRRRV